MCTLRDGRKRDGRPQVFDVQRALVLGWEEVKTLPDADSLAPQHDGLQSAYHDHANPLTFFNAALFEGVLFKKCSMVNTPRPSKVGGYSESTR